MEQTLKGRISAGAGVRVAVIGVGYVGLPLAIKFAERGFRVIGVDVNEEVVEKIRSGKSTVEGISPARLESVLSGGLELEVVNREKPAATSRKVLRKLVGVQVFIVCVPTPLDIVKEWEPDTSYIERSHDLIEAVCRIESERGGKNLPPERLVVLESTTYPGTTKKIFSHLLDDFGGEGRRWYLAYSPERTSPGLNAYDDEEEGGKKEKGAKAAAAKAGGEQKPPSTFQITRIVGGANGASSGIAAALYRTIFRKVRVVANLETAEMVKLVENTFRFTSIAFANEMASVAKTFGLNGWEVIDAARTKNFGFELCYPGLVGGHCLPIDPHYLSWAIRNRRQAATFVDVAERAHQTLRRDAFDLVQRLLNQQDRGIAKSSILFFGVSYKKNVGDIRESAAIKLMEKLYAAGAKVSFWDPARARHPAKPPIRLKFSEEERAALPKRIANRLKFDALKKRYYVEPTKREELTGDWATLKRRVLGTEFNCVIIATDHDDFRDAYAELILKPTAPPVADLANAVNWWLPRAGLKEGERARIRARLKRRDRYMLLGLH